MHASPRIAPRLALAALALIPWLSWPGLDEPFSTPKIVAIALAAAGLWLAVLASGARPSRSAGHVAFEIACVAWMASCAASAIAADAASPAATWLGLAGPAWALALGRVAVSCRAVARVMLASAAALSALSISQWLGADPFPLAGWTPEIAGGSARLRVYATLGNPNFVAAWLAMHLPLAADLTRTPARLTSRACGVACGCLLLAAIAATGSRGGALGAAAGLAGWALAGQVVRPATALMASAVLAAGLAWVSPARVLPETAAGRFYIVMVAWPHALDRPLAGLGPGAFELHYPAWEQAGRRERRLPPGLVHRFAGPQQHAHNDYLQAAIERGVPGLVTFLLVLATPLVLGTRRGTTGTGEGPPLRAALVGAVAAIAACALVDFPFQRPAETLAFWTAAALVARGPATAEDVPS